MKYQDVITLFATPREPNPPMDNWQ